MVTTSDLLAVAARAPGNLGPPGHRAWLEAEVARLGADHDELVTAAAAGMDSPDRNVRVKALRLLAVLDDRRATEGVLRGLYDPARRVREVAMKSARPLHLSSPAVVERLRAIADDEAETDRLRRNAFFILSSAAAREAVPDLARESLVDLMDSSRFRLPLLVRLCKTVRHTEASRAVLHEFVRAGTKEEAVMATRALCGQVLVRVDGWLPPERRQEVRARYDAGPEIRGTAVGEATSSACWMPAADAVALVEEMGYPTVP